MNMLCAYCGAVATVCAEIGGVVGMPTCGARECNARWWSDHDAVRDLAWRWWIRGERTPPTFPHRQVVRDAVGTDAWVPLYIMQEAAEKRRGGAP